jgi:predicted RNA polymerase sigma factor
MRRAPNRRCDPTSRTHRRATPAGPQAVLAEVNALSDTLDHYHLYHATRADEALLRRAIDWDAIDCEKRPAPSRRT